MSVLLEPAIAVLVTVLALGLLFAVLQRRRVLRVRAAGRVLALPVGLIRPGGGSRRPARLRSRRRKARKRKLRSWNLPS